MGAAYYALGERKPLFLMGVGAAAALCQTTAACLAGLALLPTSMRSARELQAGRESMLRSGCSSVRLITEDGQELDSFFKSAEPGSQSGSESGAGATGAPERKRCILYLCCQGETCETALSRLKSFRCWNVLLLNHRGVGHAGRPSALGLVLDAESALHYLTAPAASGGRGFAPGEVAVYGHSLGGGVAPIACLAFPGVAVISDRSFSSTSAVVMGLLPVRLQPFGLLVSLLSSHVLGTQLEAARAWEALRAPKIALFHPRDEAIRPCAQLQAALSGSALSSTFLLKMEQDSGEGHMRWLTESESKVLQDALLRAMPGPVVRC
jgi:pimeloyl-ACP methyl ester carboxylesterase